MAATARNTRTSEFRSGEARRRRSMIDGSLALQLDYAVRRRELEHAGEEPRPEERVRVLPRPKPARARIPVLGLLCAVMAAGFAILVLMSCIELTRLSTETVALKDTLTELETQHVVLTTEYERMFDLAAVKEAAEAAGMVKPGASQIAYLDLTEADSAVVYRQADPGFFRFLADAVCQGAAAVKDYFD